MQKQIKNWRLLYLSGANKMLKLTVRHIDVETGGMPTISLNEEFAKANDISPMDRVLVRNAKGRVLVAAVDTSEEIIKPTEVGLFEDVWKKLLANEGEIVTITPILKPESVKYIRKKMDKEELFDDEIHAIVKDIVDERLLDVEMASFVSAAYMEGLSIAEITALTRSIVDTGGRLKLKSKKILDKHCIGGVPGNRTTMVVVPIIASLGLTIPKTSSRAITSPAGTADTMETLANVGFSISELTEIVKKTNGCIVWGGAINLAAADDKLIRIRHPLSLDPEGMMLASIMAKKIAVGATHIVFDLPVGTEAKLRHLGEARHLEREFKKLAEKFKLKISTIITDGNDPIGNGIGPNLEARDVLQVLKNDRKAPQDLCNKSLMLAGKLLELAGKARPGKGKEIAETQLKSGKANEKMMEIIAEQGGDPKIKPSDLTFGEYTVEYKAEKKGTLDNIDSKLISKIARASGCPLNHEAGINIEKRYGEKVRKGETIFTVYSGSERKIDKVLSIIDGSSPVVIN